MEKDYDVGIIGSGPAALFCADELLKNPQLKIVIIEKNNYSSGGLRNDGKLNLTHRIGMDLSELGICEEEACEKINHVDNTFVKFGADGTLYGEDYAKIARLVKRAERCGLELIP